MCPHNRTLINEQYGLSVWCSSKSSIKICFANLILFMPIEELKDFMRCLSNATGVEKTGSEKDILVFIMPTPLQNMQLAFTPKEQRYLLGLCQRSILLAEQMILAN